MVTNIDHMDALEKAIIYAGGVRALARMLKIDHSNVSQWKRKQVPAKHAITIEAMTKGRIKAADFYPTHSEVVPPRI